MLLFNLAVNDFIMIVKTPVFIYNSYKCGPSYGTLGEIKENEFKKFRQFLTILTIFSPKKAAISMDFWEVSPEMEPSCR